MTGKAEDLRRLVYPETYFSALAPPELRLALLSRGIRFEPRRPLRYLELGFGNGLSLNIHAAANDGEFWGNDFVRDHVDGASAMAAISGANTRFLIDSFAELSRRDDLPEFDIVAAHGIWTWVSDADRDAIVSLLQRKLAPGGVFYVSYNNTAGWSSVVYLRQLMKLFLSEAGGADDKVVDAIAFARDLHEAGAAYFKENPIAAAEVKVMGRRNPTYLRQEYFLDDWKLMSIAEMEGALRPAGLRFGAQCTLLMHDDQLVIGTRGREILSSVQSPVLRETVRESFQGMGFRQDIFVKDLAPVTDDERRDCFRRMEFLMTTRPRNVVLQGKTQWGELDLGASGCVPVIEAFAASGFAPQSIAALEAALPQIPIDELVARVVQLAAVKVIKPALSEDEQRVVRPRCDALNAQILDLPSDRSAILASPVLGAGIEVSELERAFLSGHRDGCRSEAALAESIESLPSALRGRSPSDLAGMFLADHLPYFCAMGLAQD
ncbi:MAG: class I SAM-dependent methyltransferase [Vitreimonas sp.]